MTDRMKKILFAVVFVILSVAIGFGLYYFFFRALFGTTPPTEPTLIEEAPGALPTAGTGAGTPGQAPTTPGILPSGAPIVTSPPTRAPSGVTLIRDGVTQAISPDADGQGARFYNPEDGRFYRVSADGKITLLADKQFFNVETVSWAKREDSAILEFPDGSNVSYDFETKRQVTLPKHWEDFSFSPDDERVSAKSIGLDPSNRFLIVSNPDGNEAKAVEPLGKNAHLTMVKWSPNHQVIAFALTGKAQADGAQEVLLIGENRENFKSLIVPGRGFQPNWSPTGRQILYSVYHERDELKPSLWISGGVGDSIGEDRRGLNLQTWAEKCAWKDENELICAVPQSLDVGAGLAPLQYAGTPDDIYRVDLRTGVSVKINNGEQTRPVRNPIISADKKKLLFTDGATGRLYQYDLP